ncbi:protein regulator of cytokinesis 1-like isoform X3 [Dreissena polymorpha]|uniref:protein regulator of cytokinesis 1-like isoform X3 n=1 Tax=Dreissena polymorpha TaxID=45954 RepID=UPI002264EEFB|nr:protein regulator of cytokinesis 1-like isoform X3 [Dreissena polymorpha]
MNPSGQQELFRSIENAMAKLYQIWDRIGIGKANREYRSSTVIKHVQGLLDEIVEEEVVLERQIETRIADLTQELATLTKELQLPEFKTPPGMPVLHKEKELQTKATCLRAEKKERLQILSRLRAEDQSLCDALCLTPYYIPSGSTPSGEQLEELKAHVQKLTLEKEKRMSQFIKHKKQIADLMLEIERAPETSFEREVMVEEESQFSLSAENMHALDALLAELVSCKSRLEKTVQELWERLHVLWDRLETPKHEQEMFEEGKEGFKPAVVHALREEIAKCEAQKLANIQKFVDGMRKELETWWNKCYFSARQRSEFKYFTDANYTEDLLTLHEAEVAKVKEYYSVHQTILQLVEQREALFHKMIEFEKRANDPNRFFADRGGKLLVEEKERKALMTKLPKVEQTVKDEIMLWEKDRGRTFLVNGMSFINYIEKTWQDHEEAKLREKEERQKAKTKQLNEEMIFGSKPSTPVKRRFQPTNTPTKTPKHRKIDYSASTTSTVSSQGSNQGPVKIEDSIKTPCSSSKGQHTTVYNSPYRKTGISTGPHASRMAASNSKLQVPGSRNRRRSNRLARKVLGEKNTGTNETHMFSHTTVSTTAAPGGNMSLASTGSYQDFAHELPESFHSTKLKTPSPLRRGVKHF